MTIKPDAATSIEKTLEQYASSRIQAPNGSYAQGIRKDPFAGLPPISRPDVKEWHAHSIANYVLEHSLNEMMIASLLHDDINQNAGEISDETIRIQSLLEHNHCQRVYGPLIWDIAFPALQKLHEAAVADDQQTMLDLIAEMYVQFKFKNDTEYLAYENQMMNELVPVLKNLTADDLALAKKVMCQPFNVEEMADLRRIYDSILKDKWITEEDIGKLSGMLAMITNFYPITHEEKANFASVIQRIQEHEELNFAHKIQLKQLVGPVLISEAITMEEEQAITDKPEIFGFTQSVSFLFHRLLPDVMTMNLNLRGDHQGSIAYLGANTEFGQYIQACEQKKSYGECAELHRLALDKYVLARNAIASLNRSFEAYVLEGNDRPQMDANRIEALHQELMRPAITDEEKFKKMLFHVTKMQTRAEKRLPKAVKAMRLALDNFAWRTEMLRLHYTEFNVPALVEELRAHPETASLSDVHKDVLFAMEKHLANVQWQMNTLGAEFQSELKALQGPKTPEYNEFLDQVRIAGAAIHAHLEKRQQATVRMLEEITSLTESVRKAEFAAEDVKKASEAGHPTCHMYEKKPVAMDTLPKATIAAHHLLTSLNAIIAKMEARQPVLDQYAEREKTMLQEAAMPRRA